MDNVITLDEIESYCITVLNQRPTYGDTEEDVYRLDGKIQVVDDILTMIRKGRGELP